MHQAVDNSSTAAKEFVQLTLGKTRMLLPRPELLSLEAVPDIGPAADDGSIGRVSLNDNTMPVYNFDEQLRLLGQAQDNRCTCACLGNDHEVMGILCDKAEIITGADMQVVPLPLCMRSASTPVQALALHGTRILCLTSTERLAGLIRDLLRAGAGP